MICDHHKIEEDRFHNYTRVTCSKCSHHWEEHDMRMGRDEFELWMVILDICLHSPRNGRKPSSPTPTR